MKPIAILVLLFIVAGHALAQTTDNNSHNNFITPQILPKTPNTAMLDKFNDYQVNLFSGLPDISIPLYTIKTKEFTVPITLSYHASGLKVTEFPGWVGLGWGLEAGGQISRSQIGLPDETVFQGFIRGAVRNYAGFNMSSTSTLDYIRNESDGYKDSGADLFSYSFPGGSGKFFWGMVDSTHYIPVLIPYAPLTINQTFANSSAKSGNSAFDVQDGQGNKYHYGSVAQEYSISYSTGVPLGTGTTSQLSAWMLEKMTSANNTDVLNFAYQGQSDNYPNEPTDHCTVTDRLNEWGGPYSTRYADGTGGINNIAPSAFSQTAYHPSAVNNQTDSIYASTSSQHLQQISFINGKVIFELDNTGRQDFAASHSKALKRIKVYNTINGTDQLLQAITFYYSYFISGSNTATKRLKLDSLLISDANNTVINRYRFQYNTTMNLPVWSSRAKDYWGYYNGKVSNTTLIPHQTITYKPFMDASSPQTNVDIGSNDATSRNPDSTAMQADILTHIYYPTGGYTNFQYEANKYTENGAIKYAGGLRIKKISSYDGVSGSSLIKTYQYGTNGTGTANFILDLFSFSDTKIHEHWIPNALAPGYRVDNTATIRTYYANPTINIQPVDGAPVIYPFVTEYRTDGTNTLGKTEYRYTADLDGVAAVPANATKPVVLTRYYARGRLLNKKVYKSTGSTFQPVEEEINTYNTSAFAAKPWLCGFLADQIQVFDGFVQDPYPYPVSATNLFWQYTNYFQYSDDNYLTSTTKKSYDAADTTKYVTTSQQFTYTNIAHQQPTRITTINSQNDTVSNNTRYPADFIQDSNTATGNAVLDTMLNRNMQTQTIEQWSTLRKTGQAAYATAGTVGTYKLTNNFIVTDTENRLKIMAPLSDYQPASVSSGLLQKDTRYEPLLSYNSYDSFGNIQEVQLVNGVKEVFLWGYNGTYPVAHIIGSDYNTVNSLVSQLQINSATSVANNDAAVRTLLNSLRGLTNAQVTTYTYVPLVGVTSLTDTKGITTYYEYDGLQRLMNIKDKDGNIIKHIDYHYQNQ